MSHGISVSFCGIGFSQVETALEAGGEVSAGVEMWRKYVSCVWRQQTEGLEVSLATYARPGKKAYDSPSKLNLQARSMAFSALMCGSRVPEAGKGLPQASGLHSLGSCICLPRSASPGLPTKIFKARFSVLRREKRVGRVEGLPLLHLEA